MFEHVFREGSAICIVTDTQQDVGDKDVSWKSGTRFVVSSGIGQWWETQVNGNSHYMQSIINLGYIVRALNQFMFTLHNNTPWPTTCLQITRAARCYRIKKRLWSAFERTHNRWGSWMEPMLCSHACACDAAVTSDLRVAPKLSGSIQSKP